MKRENEVVICFFTKSERRKRWSDSYKGVSDDDEDETDAKDKEAEDAKLKVTSRRYISITMGRTKIILNELAEGRGGTK